MLGVGIPQTIPTNAISPRISGEILILLREIPKQILEEVLKGITTEISIGILLKISGGKKSRFLQELFQECLLGLLRRISKNSTSNFFRDSSRETTWSSFGNTACDSSRDLSENFFFRVFLSFKKSRNNFSNDFSKDSFRYCSRKSSRNACVLPPETSHFTSPCGSSKKKSPVVLSKISPEITLGTPPQISLRIR